jgi:predicted DNA-binding protein (MmcQ/YjbR family)
MLQRISNYALSKPGTEATFPFDHKTLVVKVMGKMYLLVDIEDPSTINLKCDPDRAVELRSEHDDIIPGFHMSKKHWNTVRVNGRLPWDFIAALIDHSYDLVVAGLPLKTQHELKMMPPGSYQY